jgi:predicted GNAT superfamily acetyltransferase
MASPSRTGRPIVAAALELDRAARAADAAAGSAGVSVRELTDLADLDRAVGLFSAIWGRSANPPMTVELLRAFAKAGNYVAGAVESTVEGDSRLVGACVGFFHAPAEDALHSHIAGVAPAAANRSVGFALKLHQRAWAMGRGVGEVVWTYDPLVARNAHFNLVKLAARPAEYLPNFYGPLTDAINGDEDSDRLLVRWRLRDPAVVAACSGGGAGRTPPVAGAVTAVGVGDDGGPRPGSLDGALSLVAVPPDIGRLRLTDPAMAQRWRAAVREALTGLVGRGGRIEGFDRAVGYVVRRHR